MFCQFCGKENPDGALFCSECGKSFENTAPATQETAEEVTSVPETTTETETPSTTEEATAFQPEEPAAFASPYDVPTPKKKFNFKKLIPVGAVAAVVAVVAVSWSSIQGAFIKTFGSDEAYFSYVETKSINSATDRISTQYGNLIEGLKKSDNTGAEASIKLNVGDKAVSILEDALDEYADIDTDLAWLDTVTLKYDTSAKENLSKIYAELDINKKKIIDMEAIMNMENGDFFFAFLDLSDKYLSTELDLGEQEEIMEILRSEELRKALPSEKEFDKLLTKYTEVIFDNIEGVEKGSDTVEVAGISQKLTTLEVEITPEVLAKVVLAVLETAKDDKTLKNCIEDMAVFLEDNDLIEDADEAYERFIEAVEDGIDEMEDLDIDDDAFELILTDYVNSKHEIVGRKIEANDEEVLNYVKVKKGSKIAFELTSGDIELQGEGTEKGKKINAECTLEAYDNEICDIIITDYKTDSDYLNGNFRIAPSKDLLENMGVDSRLSSFLSISDPMLEIDVKSSKKSAEISVNLINSDEIFVGFTVSGKETSASKIKVPDSKDVYDEDEADEWAEELEDALDVIIERLEKAKVSPEIIELLEDNL